MSLNGSFHDFTMLETLQLIGLQRKTGSLEVESSPQRRELQFHEGRLQGCYATRPQDPDPLLETLVLLALCDSRQARSWRSAGEHREPEALRLHCGLEADELEAVHRFVVQGTVDQILLWDHGLFRFEPSSASRAPATSYHLEEIVLESMRRLDETAELRAGGLAPDAIPHVVGAVRPGMFEQWDLPDRWVTPAVARQCDGRRSIRRLVQETGLSEYDLLQTLTALRQRGLVRIAMRGKGATAGEGGGEPARRTSPRLAPIGAVLLVGAAIAAGWSAHRLTESETGREVRLEAQAREHFETERALRHFLELRRIRAGRYPASLDELPREGLWPARSEERLHAFAYRPAPDGLAYALAAAPGASPERGSNESNSGRSSATRSGD